MFLIQFTHQTAVNIYIVYEMNFWPFKRSSYFTLGNALFWAVIKNADFDKYRYSGYGIGVDVNGSFFF